jgi:hypothetical protein
MNTFPAHQEMHYIVNSVVDASGVDTSVLRPHQLGVFDAMTYKSVGSKIPNDFIFAIGSPHVSDKNSPVSALRQSNPYSVNISRKSQVINTRDTTFKASTFEATTKNTYPTWYLGYDGLNICRGLDFKCDTTYYVSVNLSGYAVEAALGKDMQDIFIFKTDCCGENCTVINSKEKYVDKIIEYFNKRALYFKDFIKTSKIIKRCSPSVVVPKVLYKKYCLSVCDAGNASALSKVQSKYSFEVNQTKRQNGISTYETDFILATDPVPSPFLSSVSIISDCDVCPSGTTTVAGTNSYTITILNTDSDKTEAQWLTEVQAKYSGALKATKVNYTHGTSTYVVNFATSFVVPAVIPVGTTIDFLKAEKATCVTTPSTFTWSACGDCYKITRKLKMTVKNPDCAGQSYLTEIQAAHTNRADIVPNSLIISASPAPNACNTVYEIQQYSSCMTDGCDYTEMASFPPLSGWNGFMWEIDACEGWTVNANGCPVPPIDNDVDFVAGLRFDVKIDDTKLYEGCGYSYNDSISHEPLILSVAFGEYKPDFANKCVDKNVPLTQVSSFLRENGRGHTMIPRLIKTEFENGIHIPDPSRMEYGYKTMKAMGINFDIEPTAYYNSINVIFESSSRSMSHEPTNYRTFSYFFYWKMEDFEVGAKLKTLVNKILAKQDLPLI